MPVRNEPDSNPIELFSLLSAKFFVPHLRGDFISRPRFIEQLSQVYQRGERLILLSAPAGYGKSTLLSEWIHSSTKEQDSINFAWLTVDQQDNDFKRFSTYLVAAIKKIEPTFGKAISNLLGSDQSISTDTILTLVINELVSLENPLVIILDDYHAIDLSAIHHFISGLLDYLPPHIRIAISTRVDLPFSLARMRGAGQILEIRAADLCFNQIEVKDFLDQAQENEFSSEQIARITSRTEGWPASLLMLRLALRNLEDPAAFIDSFSGSQTYIADYFTDEVLGLQTEQVRQFLLRTCILEQMSDSLCDAVTGLDNSAEILQQLFDSNIFISQVDGERGQYRYHRLFSDLLRHRLQTQYPQEISSLHHRAAQWYYDNGDLERAVQHALASSDFPRVVEWITPHLDRLWQQGRSETILNWGEKISPEVRYSSPDLMIYYIRALCVSGKLSDAQENLNLSGLKVRPLSDQQMGKLALVEAMMLLNLGQIKDAAVYSENALEKLPQALDDWRSSAYVLLGIAKGWRGNLQASTDAYSQAVTLGQKQGKAYFSIDAGFRLASNLFQLGKLTEAYQVCQTLISTAAKKALDDIPVVGPLWSLQGSIYYQRNQLDRANEVILEGIRKVEQGSNLVAKGFCYLSYLNLLFSNGDYPKIRDMIQKTEALGQNAPLPGFLANGIAANKIRLWAETGDFDAALNLAGGYQLNAGTEIIFTQLEIYISYFRLLLAIPGHGEHKNELAEGLVLIRQLIEKVSEEGLINKLILLRVLAARFSLQMGNKADSMRSLKKGLDLAHPEGFQRVFIDEGSEIKEMLQGFQRGDQTEFVHKLLTSYDPDENGLQRKERDDKYSLSPRELDVLEYLPSHLSEMEIAEDLCITYSTVHSHIKKIYQKMGVNNRSAAVNEARNMKLL